MSVMRYKFDTAAGYSLDGDVGAALATTKTSDPILMELDTDTGVAGYVGARVSFTVTPGGNTDDTLRCAVLFSGDGTNYDTAPSGVLFLGAMGVGDVPHTAELNNTVLDKLLVANGGTPNFTDTDLIWSTPPNNIWNFRIENNHTGAVATPTYVSFSVQVIPAAVAMKIHLYKSSGETAVNTFTISGTSIQRWVTTDAG